jgi:hypothetical protein
MAKRLILIFSALVIASCGSRKVETAKIAIDTKVDSVVITKVDGTYVQNNNVITSEDCEELEYKPLDSTKVMVIDGKSFFNTIIKAKKKSKRSIDTTKTQSRVSISKKEQVIKTDKTKAKEAKVDRKANYYSYLWLLILPVLYFLYKQILKRFLI